MKKYKWKRPWDVQGISASIAVKTFKKIEKEFGQLTPETLLEHSKSSKSPFHNYFEWDNNQAGEKWRLYQARLLVNNVEITFISNGESKSIGAYEIIKTDNDQKIYKNITTFSQEDVDFVRQSAIQSLSQWSKKLKFYKEFQSISFEIDQIVERLSRTE